MYSTVSCVINRLQLLQEDSNCNYCKLNHSRNKMNHHITGVTASVFIIVFLCFESNWANHIHRRPGRSYSATDFDYIDDDDGHIRRCNILCHEHSCKREYIQSRARFFLSCFDANDIREGPCTRHRNGTFCETLIQKYFASHQAYRYYYSYRYNPDSNRSCSYSECSGECPMILQQLKATWGCCFHYVAQSHDFERGYHLKGFTTQNHSHNYWRSCGIQPPEKCHNEISEVTIDTAECTTMEQFGHLLSEYKCTPLP